MEEIINSDEMFKKNLSIHLYGRFAYVRDIIEANRKRGESFRILDVGGRGNLTKDFLPNDKVFYLDPGVETEDSNFIQGDGCAMPLKDESFDWVVSTDVFEHIPPEKRRDFLSENIRVAKYGTLLLAPFSGEDVSFAERSVNTIYRELHDGEDHRWLKEHIENGLPDTKDITDFLREKHLSFQIFHHNNILLWQLFLSLEFFVGKIREEDIQKQFSDLNYLYNTNFFSRDNQEPSYRKVFYIKKHSRAEEIFLERKTMKSIDFLFLQEKAIRLLATLVSRYEEEKKQKLPTKKQSQTKKEIKKRRSSFMKKIQSTFLRPDLFCKKWIKKDKEIDVL